MSPMVRVLHTPKGQKNANIILKRSAATHLQTMHLQADLWLLDDLEDLAS
jgi:hypothetical protein